jgi:hypothetical protein
MLEVYRVNDGIRALYRLVADSARDWDRRNLIIDLRELAA